jgi:hypothetical protein
MQIPDSATLKHYADIAESQVQAIHKQVTELVQSHKHLLVANPAPLQTWTSDALAMGWASGLYITLSFSNGPATFGGQAMFNFTGQGGGISLGVGNTWGTFVASVDPLTIRGRDTNFQYNIAVSGMNVNFYDKNTGVHLGSYVGAGVSFGVGIGGGAGTFS